MNVEKDFILIEEYLDGHLEGEALADFEQRLKVDAELANELALYREVNEKIAASTKKKQLKKEWNTILTENKAAINLEQSPPKEVARVRKLTYYLIRMTGVLAVALVIYLLWPKPLSDQQLAVNYWEATTTFDYTTIDRSNDQNADYLIQLKKAYDAYGEKDYLKAEEVLQAITPRTDEVILLEGAIGFQQEHYELAIRNFNKIQRDQQSLIKDEAIWYLALTYLKSGNQTDALTTLDAIIAQQSWNYKEAEQLFEQISE